MDGALETAGRLAGVLLLILGLGACRTDEQMESHYSNMQEAAADGAIERGWIPAWLPGSATDIREVHDVDTNEVWIRFQYEPGQFSPPSTCSPAAIEQIRVSRGPSLWRGRWWPRGRDTIFDGSPSVSAYRCDVSIHYAGGSVQPRTAIFVVNDQTGLGYWVRGPDNHNCTPPNQRLHKDRSLSRGQ
jgi:hypothetical protein